MDDKIIELTDEVGDVTNSGAKDTVKEEAGDQFAVRLAMEPEAPDLSTTEKVIQDLNKKIEQAEEAGSYFVTITRKEGEKLKHWMGSVKFPKDDRAHSLREILKMVPSAYHGKKGNVRKFGPRKHGG